ncbi:hypothetical protein LEN26_017977 [Aphanomyces euteiches]|nr:hypothetical protein LEN26_017977 [Aphanomyces euteiches]KAH9127569.1 hypothetical protein AeMF1_002150 [Aphanomyces euteiches]
MSAIQQAVSGSHASRNTIMHALYGYYYLGLSKDRLAIIYNKHRNTVDNWIRRFEVDENYKRRESKSTGLFTVEQRQWVINYYMEKPLSFLDEVKTDFQVHFNRFISITTIWRIVHESRLTWKVLERRAIHIKMADIVRFTLELGMIDWSQQNIQFLDEVSFDNQGMVRRRGYAMKGEKLCIRGEFTRKARVSLLCFLDVGGIVETFYTDGTFDRSKFVECCRLHAHSKKSVKQYPGRGSIWILDGARVHFHPDIVYYLRSLGIIPIFLPAYCPFFNPIEYMFGLMKKSMKRQYQECKNRSTVLFALEIVEQFRRFDMQKIYQHCGWTVEGNFDPRSGLSNDRIKLSKGEEHSVDELLEFAECGESNEETGITHE